MQKVYMDKKTEITLVFFLSVFILGMLIFSCNTSPLYPDYNRGDSALFTLVGKGICEGKTVYTDLFDHKGPMLFFIEALGYYIGNTFGIFLIQCLFGIINLIFLYSTCKKINEFYKRPIINLILSFIGGYSMFFYTFQCGNLSEEFSLPFISCCIYFFVSYAINTKKTTKHPYIYSFIYGIALASLFLIRMNNAVTVIAGIFAIFVFLIHKKNWKNLFLNILSGIAGCLVVALPVFTYFFFYSALDEMIYATFIYNFKYAGTVGYNSILKNPITYTILFIPVIYSLFLSAHKLIKCKNQDLSFLDFLIFAIVLVNTICLTLINQFPHYFEIYVPAFILVLFQYQDYKTKNLKTALFALCVVACLIKAVLSCSLAFYKTYISKDTLNEYNSVYSEILQIPEDERFSIIGYDIPVRYYLHSDILPCYKYYTHQEWWSVSNPDIKTTFMDWLNTQEPLWVITKPNKIDTSLQEILSNKYILKSENKYLKLYRSRK